MMENIITELGVGGIFAILLIRESSNLMARLKGEPSPTSPAFVCHQCRQLLENLTLAIKEQIEALRDIHQSIEMHETRTSERLHYFEKQVDKITSVLTNGKAHYSRGEQQ